MKQQHLIQAPLLDTRYSKCCKTLTLRAFIEAVPLIGWKVSAAKLATSSELPEDIFRRFKHEIIKRYTKLRQCVQQILCVALQGQTC